MVIKKIIPPQSTKVKKTARGPLVKSKAKKLKVTKTRYRDDKKIIKSDSLHLVRQPNNPIITPLSENSWENRQTFNPGVILIDDKIHFIYRAIGDDGSSRFGYACSSDGFNIDERLSDYVYQHAAVFGDYFLYSFLSGGSFNGSEDPRLVRIDDDSKIYMTYTACDDGLRMALSSINIDDFLNKKWNWEKPIFLSPPHEVQKNWVLFPNKINGKYAILHSINPKIAIEYRDNLDFVEGQYINSSYGGWKGNDFWDNKLRGAGPPPLKTEDGWLLLYHAMDHRDPSKYKVGAMLLDLKNPEKVLYKSPSPILEPEESYEENGYKPGVIYASGAVIKGEDLLVYYGSADSYVCVASMNLKKFLKNLKQGAQLIMKPSKIKKAL